MSVEIRMNNNYDFEAGQPRVVDCVVVGCVPPPAITWHLGSTMVRPSVHKVSPIYVYKETFLNLKANM